MKTSLGDLAIMGSAPAFADALHVGRPNVGDRAQFLQRIGEMVDRRWLTNDGPLLQELEQRIAATLKVRHCVAVCNGTVALELAIRALQLTGEVIVPSFTFVATAHALAWSGVRPVFADINPDTHTLDPTQVEQAISPLTTGIVGVHTWGRPCAIDALTEIARAHGLHLLFDAAHAFSCTYRGTPIGGFGDAEILSFHATKFFHTLEGGAVVTDNDDLAQRVRLMRNFGFAGYDRVVGVGTNGKMNEACAAMGLTNLEHLDEFITANLRNYEAYRRTLDGVQGVTIAPYNDQERCNYQYVVLEIDGAQAGLSRDELLEVLWAEGVLARRYFYPGIHKLEPYRTWDPNAGTRLPHTEQLTSRVLTMPTGTAIGPDDITVVTDIIRVALDHAEAVRDSLKHGRISSRAETRQR